MNDTEALLEMAKKEIVNLKHNECFSVRDLFKGYIWNRIPRGERLTLGILFLNYAKSQTNLEVCEKNKANQQIYRKI